MSLHTRKATVKVRATEPKKPAGTKNAGKALELRLQEHTKMSSMFFAG